MGRLGRRLRAAADRRCAHDREEGATLVIVSLLAIVLLASGALAVDIASLAMERQRLHDHIDSAAHAGAFELPTDGDLAQAEAVAMAQVQDPVIDPDVDFFCIVASTGAAATVRTDQIPATCNPGPSPYTSPTYPGLRCDEKICAIPCVPAQGDQCNSIRVTENKTVPFGLARAIGINQGDTGAVSSVACKGSCGDEDPNPMDVVILADRTPSMADNDRESMKEAILDSLDTMDPDLHYVAFGAMHKSKTRNFDTWCATEDTEAGSPEEGTWLPLEFSNDYVIGEEDPRRNNASDLVRGIDCLPASSRGNHGTHLASPLKAAARYLTGRTPNNLSSLPDRPGEVTKMIIIETDGRPEEAINRGYSGLGSSADIGYHYTRGNAGTYGCENFVRMAEEVKSEDIIVMTIGFGQANTFNCNRNGSGARVRDYLAEAASPHPKTGAPSQASNCANPSGRTAENQDGDFFFCAASGAGLAPLFKTAISQVTSSIRLIKLP